MSESTRQNETDSKLPALRSRLAECIGYLAARRWLAGGDTGEKQPPIADNAARVDQSENLSYKSVTGHALDADSR